MHDAMRAAKARSATHTPGKVADISSSRRNAALCALAVALSVFIIYPIANMPFGDDFSYTKTALDFARTGNFVYNGWATAMLGWLIPWGALFIKVFGFSFTVVRLSMLPIAMASVYLFHQILRRFAINPQSAVLGALTLGLSPLFLPMASTYMTDVPGLFVILICIYMCQRAVAAHSDRGALLWLCFASLVNVAGGTVRQIAWLGALIMVPSTAWLLRDRRGMKLAGTLLFLFSFMGVLACLHWFNQQPYSVPEHVIDGPVHIGMLRHLAAQLLKTFFCLLLIIFPVSAGWMPTAYRLREKPRLVLAGSIAVVASLACFLYVQGALDAWTEPWLVALLQSLGMWDLSLWMRLGISLLAIAPALILAVNIVITKRNEQDSSIEKLPSWNEVAWILVPFTLSYVGLLAPRATFSFVQDRYVLGLMPSAIVFLLKVYQERIAAKPSPISVVALAVFTVYTIGSTHDLFVGCRALVRIVQMVQSDGVPRNSIQAGMASDGWTQIEPDGHINDSRIQVPSGAYNPQSPNLNLPANCTLWFASLTPSIRPKYFLVFPPMPCFIRAKYPSVEYRTWLPPFHRALYVQQLKVVK